MTVTPATAAAPATPRTPAAQAPSPGLESDYLTFLNMLTVQMQNQDPLNPMASTDFAVQLATFSGVEQQVETNRLLAALVERSALADLEGWVGMEARVAGDAWFDGAPITLAPERRPAGEAATLVVRDAMGTVVDRRDLPADGASITWQGVGADGMALPEGRYRFVMEQTEGGRVIDATPVPVYQPVREARREDGQTVLVLAGGLMVESGQVSGLRAPVQGEGA